MAVLFMAHGEMKRGVFFPFFAKFSLVLPASPIRHQQHPPSRHQMTEALLARLNAAEHAEWTEKISTLFHDPAIALDIIDEAYNARPYQTLQVRAAIATPSVAFSKRLLCTAIVAKTDCADDGGERRAHRTVFSAHKLFRCRGGATGLVDRH